MKCQPTLRDIAHAGRVHHTTVSRALRNDASIPVRTRDRIRKIADKMGYRPNPLLSAWVTHRKKSPRKPVAAAFAYLICFKDIEIWRKNPSIYRYYTGAKERARELGFTLDHFWLGEPGMTARRMSGILKTRGIRGVIVGSSGTSHAHLNLEWESFAAVTQGFTLTRPNLWRTACHYGHAMNVALRQLRRLGYRRIGHVISPAVDARVDRLWTSAFLYYQQLIAGRDRVPPLFWEPGENRRLEGWFARYRPEAIVTPNREAHDHLSRIGVRVPHDVGFACVDWQKHLAGWAGVDLCIERAGRAAIDLLVEQLIFNERGVPAQPKTLLTEGVWVDGHSVRRQREAAPLTRLPKSTRVVMYAPGPDYFESK
jgi:LacI family transcriptional regulator